MAGRRGGGVERDDVVMADLDVLIDETSKHDPAFGAAVRDTKERLGLFRLFASARRKAGLSQADVAKQMGTTQSAISELEQGQVEPRLSTLQRYARIIGCRLPLKLVSEPIALYQDRVFHYPPTNTTPVKSRRRRRLVASEEALLEAVPAVQGNLDNVLFVEFRRSDKPSPLTKSLAQRIETAATA